MSGNSADTDTSKGAAETTTDDATKDASAKAGESQEDGKATDADKKSGDDTTALKKALKAERDRANALEKAQREAELSKLPELERFKAEAEELAKENEKLSAENMRMKVALDMGLPWKLAKRLSGDDEDAIRDDAADLLKDYTPAKKQVVPDDPKNKRPPNDAKKNGSAGGPGMNDILRALAGRKGS
jgi:hypothetical protein